MADFNGRGLTLLAIGGIVAYSGVKGKSISGTVRSFLKGNDPNTVAQSAGITNSGDLATTSGGLTDTPRTGNATANRGLGQLLAAQYGWVGNEWSALDSLWTRESGWNNYADNPSSHAYGIPQALPASKLPRAGQPLSLGGASSAVSQIAWGLVYIKTRYGSPSVAWQHEQENDWY